MKPEQLIRSALKQGWRVRRGKHHVMYAPDGKTVVVVSATPSDHRDYRNTLARMRRAGYKD